jgi:lactate racemase
VNSCTVRTAAWYGDRELELGFPDSWEVVVHRPSTPSPLSIEEVASAFDQPVGQQPLGQLAVGSALVAIVVDDLTRPTPASVVLPTMLRQIDEAGVASDHVVVVVGTGTHRAPAPEAVRLKVGDEVLGRYRVLVHDDQRDLVRVGRTTRGTPVVANQVVASADLVIGVGGVYPQHSVGFGGGVKSILGVLGRHSIRALHYGHESMDGEHDIDNPFRRDLSEMASMLGMRTGVAVHVDAERRPVRVVAGDPRRLYRDAVAFSEQQYLAPSPGDADVVVSNAYPMDTSLTFMRSKGILPLLQARTGASRVVLAACPEGNGHHGLFPFVDLPPFYRERDLARVVAAHPARSVRKVGRRVRKKVVERVGPPVTPPITAPQAAVPEAGNPIHLVRPGEWATPFPSSITGMVAAESWNAAIALVRREQGFAESLRVVVYASAPLQVLPDPSAITKLRTGT